MLDDTEVSESDDAEVGKGPCCLQVRLLAERPLKTLLEHALKRGKPVGFVAVARSCGLA